MFGKEFFNKTEFFDLFDKQAEIAVKGAYELMNCFSSQLDPAVLGRIKPLEHEADVVAHHCMEVLHTRFMTPFDRDQIHLLIGKMDDIIDSIDSAVDCIVIYRIQGVETELIEFSELIVKAAEAVQRGVKDLRNLRDVETIRKNCADIYRFEHEADITLNSALGRLFDEEPDAKQVIKWKGLYEVLEETTDRCADVADLLEQISLENS